MRWQTFGHDGPSLQDKLRQVRWPFILVLCATGGVGVAMLYSAAGGSMQPWAIRRRWPGRCGAGHSADRGGLRYPAVVALGLPSTSWRWCCSSSSMWPVSSAWERSAGSISKRRQPAAVGGMKIVLVLALAATSIASPPKTWPGRGG
ncbi:MAG: hypothetical protein U1E38_10405 [Rhodospirillales bacterium]